MELALLVWGISILGGITVMCAILGIIFTGIALGYFISKEASYENEEPIKYRWLVLYSSIALAFYTTANLIPSEKTAYMMVAAYASQKVIENPATKELSGKVLLIINNKLDEYIEAPKVAE